MEKSRNNDYSLFAAKGRDTKRGYEKEKEHEFRSKFERDRDRILYSKGFRRLSGKTQVFVTGVDDHLRTRLTHTLEVSQITTTICRALNLNEILGEAIAIGHDIGHTPFGHVGERTLNYIMNGCDKIKNINKDLEEKQKGFKHNWQGVRVVMDLEEISKEYKGLNLTKYTLWGILNHSKLEYSRCDKEIGDKGKCSLRQTSQSCVGFKEKQSVEFYREEYKNQISEDDWTVEAMIVKQADEIAQRHHDIEDALETDIIDKDELIKKIKDQFGEFIEGTNKEDDLKNISKEDNKTYYLPMLSKFIVDLLTTSLIESIEITLNNLEEKYNLKSKEDFIKNKKTIIEDFNNRNQTIFEAFSFEEILREKEKEFQSYLVNRILNSHLAQSMDGKSDFIIRQLIKAYVSNPQQLPDKTIISLYKSSYLEEDWEKDYKNKSQKYIVGELRNKLKRDHTSNSQNDYKGKLLRTICDYIAGMTDAYAMEQFNLLYGPKHIMQI